MSEILVEEPGFLARLGQSRIVSVNPEEVAVLLHLATTFSEDDTGGGRMIRVLRLAGQVLIQEETPKGEMLLRRSSSLADARRFVDDRLATYERMWDGCGCKIDYTS